ncbi:dynein axonemal assembly factor 5 [Calliphora vicina]|uniref:dynein axonemal assembly factor 5 n=1 Tax=Calliphora vicina TaxID=7373 RepID=UPI00325A9638
MTLNVDQICEKLQLQDRRAKIETLKLLQQKCLDAKDTADIELLHIFDEIYLHLLKCYSDRFESVRDHAVQTVNMFLDCLPPNDFHLVNIVSTLAERMGQQETLEESEEIRLVFMQQLLKLETSFISSTNKCCMQDCYEDIIRIMVKALNDPYPAVQKEACACVTALASSADTYVFKPFAERLAKGLYGMLNHKHSQARIAAVHALSYVALHIDAGGDALSRLIMEISPLLMDSMPLVRRECGELGVRLLLELRDRYSYFERLIPLVLCCLKDDSPEVQSYILPLWEKCGKQYYDENETELNKQELADLIPPNYPPNIKRPTIGCRGIVQRSLRLLKLIVRESNDWKENVRLHSLKLLYQFVLHAEATMTAKFFEIYEDVARATRDSEPTVIQEAFKVSDLMGRLLNYDDWYEHGFEGLERNAKEGYLKCFYYMYSASLGVQFEHNVRLSKILAQPEYSQTLKCDFQLYVLKMVETILDKCKGVKDHKDKVELYRNCYCSTIKVMSLSVESEQTNCEELQNKALNILIKICDDSNCNLDDLHEQFFVYALESVQDIDAPLDALSEPILLLYGLIKLAKFRPTYLKELQQKINTVFEHCADESKVKIFSAVSIAMLDWNSSIRRSLIESCDHLKEFVISVVEPHLIWKAGANAEAMRSLATATICSLSQGAPEEATHVLPHMAKYMPPLLEDQSISTRHYAIKCLYNFGEIDIEHLKPIAYACLQRLDDPSSGIRILAASVVPKLQLQFNEQGKSNGYESDAWLSFIKNCFDLLFLHYDSPEERLQTAIKDTIIELGKRYPKILNDSYKRTMVATHNCYNLKELEKHLPTN